MSVSWILNCPDCDSENIDDLGNRLSPDKRETIWDFICLDCDRVFEAIEPDAEPEDDPPESIDLDIDRSQKSDPISI